MIQHTCPFPPDTALAAYLRDSGGPEQEQSVEQQLAEARRYCERHRLRLDESLVFVDRARSGKSTDARDDFYRMIAALDKTPRPCDGLLLWSSARFARNQLDAQYYKALLRRRGYTLVFLSGDVPDAGPLTAIFEAAVDWKNEQYLADLRKEIKRGMRWVMGQGAFVGGTPTGFQRVQTTLGVKRNGKPRIVSKLEMDERIAPRVAQAFEMRARGCTLKEIHGATHLFNARQPEYNYTRLLRNPIYKGTLQFDGGAIEHYVASIVPPDLWEQVQQVNRQAREQLGIYHRRRSSNDEYCLSGLAHCAACGKPMWTHTTRDRLKSGIAVYRYYVCQSERTGECRLRVGAAALEAAVMAQVEQDCLTDEALVELEARLKERERSAQRPDAAAAALKNKLTAVEREIDNLTRSAASAPLSKSLGRSLEQKEVEVEQLRSRLEEAKTPKRGAVDIRAVAGEIREALAAGNPRRLRRALARVVSRIDVSRESARVTYHDFAGMSP